MTESFIPIINLGIPDADEKETAKSLVSAFSDVGFVYIINHGITNEEVCFQNFQFQVMSLLNSNIRTGPI